tara:strand:+ start:9356 stop:10318 length:963 start_codon:yes stop_codon:yes gene_type:complete
MEIEVIYEDSVSIRAIDILDDGSLAFAGSDGKFGLYNPVSKSWNTRVQQQDSLIPSFRAVAHTATDFFMLSIANPALLYKTGDTGKMELVYQEEGEQVFYDSMKFWNDKEGIAMGDAQGGCLSIIITRDGGNTWKKLDCSVLPEATEGAFAASNTNVEVMGNHAWIITGGIRSRVFHTADKGRTWEVVDTPLLQGKETQGGYSIDFYDDKNGFVIGGDYTDPEGSHANKARTIDGGKTWQLVAEGQAPGYKSCVQYVPNKNGNELVAIGFTGIDYSKDGGDTWKTLSTEGFFTIRFVDENQAYAAGNGRIALITLKRNDL